MDSVFEVCSPVLNKNDVDKWIRKKLTSIVSDVEMFKRMGLILDYVIIPTPDKTKLDIRGVFNGGTVFSLRVGFNIKNVGSCENKSKKDRSNKSKKDRSVVLCDVGFSWITPPNKTRKRLASVKDLKSEFRQKKFWYAFSEKRGSKILVRWDNKPYHDDAGTWPFHKHFGGQKVPACPSQEQSVAGFLEFIKTHLGNM